MIDRWLSRARSDRTLRREADMMAFTVCIALLAVLVWGHEHAEDSQLDLLAIVWGTTLGLALTHWFALILSVRLVADPNFSVKASEMLIAQTLMAVLVASVASVVVLVLSPAYERLGARVTAALFLGALVGVESRAGGASMRRTIAFVVVALTIGLTIAIVKGRVGK